MTGPRIGALFAGYGGLEMGVQSVLGGDLAWYSEIDRGALKILTHRHPDVPNVGDVTTADWSQVEPVDILTGGSPCQDLSHAGKRAGMTDGTRSNLWVAMREAIARLRPGLVVWENVRGAYSAEADSGLEFCPGCMGDAWYRGAALRALGRVLGDLSDLGYDAGWHGLRAADVGAPHGRMRVFVVSRRRRDLGPDTFAAYISGGVASRTVRGGGLRHASDGLEAPADRAGVEHDGRGRGAEVCGPVGDREYARPIPAGEEQHGDEAVLEMASLCLCRRGETLKRDVAGAVFSPSSPDRGSDERGIVGTLLPTPRSSDSNGSGAHGDGGLDLPTTVALLPTPAVNDMGAAYTPDEWDAWTDRMKTEHGNGNGHGKSLSIEAARLLQTPRVADGTGGPETRGGARSDEPLLNGQAKAMHGGQWGDYAAAIARWEHTTRRPAPAPTMTSTKGNPQLAPAFVEWMMGLPAGWVTDTPGITRNEALKALGNGVVPQQAEAALRYLLGLTAAPVQPDGLTLLGTPTARDGKGSGQGERLAESARRGQVEAQVRLMGGAS